MMSKDSKIYFDEVIAHINKLPAPIPAQRTGFRHRYSFSSKTFAEQLPVWQAVWANGNWRARLHAFFFLEQCVGKAACIAAVKDIAILWQEDVDDWPLCDSLAKLNTKTLEAYEDEVYAVLAKWNTSTDLWKRRQSVVSLLYYSRTKKKYLPLTKITALVLPLLADKEYYVQKGVGWTLREMWNVYPQQTLQLLQQHIKSISAIAFTIAIEKLSVEEKNKLKAIRR